MSFKITSFIYPAMSLFLTSQVAFSLELHSKCFKNINNNTFNAAIDGENVNSKSPIASLSKIFTTYWALHELGPHYQFETQVYLKKVSADMYDVHLKGSSDPYFSNDKLQYLVAQLNSRGIYNIRNLTVDANFLYMHNVALLAGSDPLKTQDRYTMTPSELTKGLADLLHQYSKTRSNYYSLTQKSLPESIHLQVSQIKRENSNDTLNKPDSRFTLKSAENIRLLQHMNKYSNNHIAEFYFSGLGGLKKFNSFISSTLGLSTQDLEFINGSGGPAIVNNKKVYNYASCSAVLNTLSALTLLLKQQNLNIWNVMPVAGIDYDMNDKSTVSKNYVTPTTQGALIGKTGTVNPVIGLAGLVSSQQNQILFVEIYSTVGSQEWSGARTQILNDLESIFRENKGSLKVSVQDLPFVSFE